MSPEVEVAPNVVLEEEPGVAVRKARPERVYLSSARIGITVRPVENLIPMSDGIFAAPPASARGTRIEFEPVPAVKPLVWGNAFYYYKLTAPVPGDTKAEEWYDRVLVAIEGRWEQDAQGNLHCVKEGSYYWKRGQIWREDLYRQRQYEAEGDKAEKQRIIVHLAHLQNRDVKDMQKEVEARRRLYVELCAEEEKLLRPEKEGA